LVAEILSLAEVTEATFSFGKLLKLNPHVHNNAHDTRISKTETTSRRIDFESFISIDAAPMKLKLF
ncbi:MAG: hypothetical protein ABIP79_07440, partial [Chitinophagaceae bacterium]